MHGDEVRLRRCTGCSRLTVDWPGVVRADSCFYDHDAAPYETVASLKGAAAVAVWALFQARQVATDGELQGELRGRGVESIESAVADRIDIALGDIRQLPTADDEGGQGVEEGDGQLVEVAEEFERRAGLWANTRPGYEAAAKHLRERAGELSGGTP